MSNEKRREDFEAWHCEQYKTKHMTGAPARDMHNGVHAEDYGSKKQQALWECWQETGGDSAKVEALKGEIERIEEGKQPVAWFRSDALGCAVWKAGATRTLKDGAPLFTRSDADEADRLNEVIEQQKALIASLRNDLQEAIAIDCDDDAKDACAEVERTGTPGSVIREMKDELVDLRARLAERDALLRECQPALEKAGISTWQIDELLSASAETSAPVERQRHIPRTDAVYDASWASEILPVPKCTDAILPIDPGKEIVAIVESALRRSFNLGQLYWQQADSDSTCQQNKSEQTMEVQAQHILNVVKSITELAP